MKTPSRRKVSIDEFYITPYSILPFLVTAWAWSIDEPFSSVHTGSHGDWRRGRRGGRRRASTELPQYFNQNSATLRLDTTGGAAGVWATPAGDGKGDDPSKLGNGGSVRSRLPQSLFDQYGVGVDGRLSRHVHAGRVRHGGNRVMSCKERCAHYCHEFHGIPIRLFGLLGVRFRHRLGQLV